MHTVLKLLLKLRNLLVCSDWNMFTSVAIEVNTDCNRKCAYCPNSNHEQTHKFMDDWTFRFVLTGLVRMHFWGVFYFHFYNEPLMCPTLKQKIRMVKNNFPFSRVHIVTNSDYLDDRVVAELMEDGVAKIAVTLHDADKERQLSNLKDRCPTMFNHLSIGEITTFQNRGGNVALKPVYVKSCNLPEHIVFGYNGDVILCCNDYMRTAVFGNIHKQPLWRIWDDYADVRRKIRRGKYSLPVCRKCVGLEDK